MEGYTLLIFQAGSSTYAEDEALNYYKTHRTSNKHVSLSRQSYLAVLKLTLDENDTENQYIEASCFSWIKHDELDDSFNTYDVSNWLTFAAAINILADRLPDVGQYYMDVLCCGEIFSKELPEDKAEICISLERLEIWHNAHIVIRKPKDSNVEQLLVLEKWAYWLNASICNDPWPFPDFKLWHGSLALPMDLFLPGFEMLLLSPESGSVLSSLESHSLLRKLVLDKQVTHVATSLEVLSDCSLMSVPPYIFSRFRFLLQIPTNRRTYNACHSFVEFLENRPGMAIVFALHFTCSGSSDGHQTLDFEAWTKSFLSGKLPEEHPQTHLPEDSPHLTFLMYWDPSCCRPRRSLVAHLLMDPSDLDLGPCLPPSVDNLWHLTLQDEQCPDLFDLIPKLDDDLDIDVPSEDNLQATADHDFPLDPSDWPERRFLLLREMRKQKAKGSLDGLTPPTALRKVIELKANDFLNYFDSSGKPKRCAYKTKSGGQVHILEGGQGKFSVKAQHSLEDTLSMNWPDSQQCQYHDLYFNLNTWTEELEVSCNQLKDQFVLEETASSNPNKEGSRVICVVPNVRHRETFKRNITSPKKGKGSQNQSFSKTVRRSPRKSVSSSRTQTKLSPEETSNSFSNILTNSNKHVPNKNKSLPNETQLRQRSSSQSRSSQRFKSSSEQVSSTDKQKSNDLSDLHKKKLREAVALALESEGITLNSPSFKLCGRRLFTVCKAFVKDILGKGNTSTLMKKIAAAHVKQVIEFEKIQS